VSSGASFVTQTEGVTVPRLRIRSRSRTEFAELFCIAVAEDEQGDNAVSSASQDVPKLTSNATSCRDGIRKGSIVAAVATAHRPADDPAPDRAQEWIVTIEVGGPVRWPSPDPAIGPRPPRQIASRTEVRLFLDDIKALRERRAMVAEPLVGFGQPRHLHTRGVPDYLCNASSQPARSVLRHAIAVELLLVHSAVVGGCVFGRDGVARVG